MRTGAGKYKLKPAVCNYKFRVGDLKYKLGPGSENTNTELKVLSVNYNRGKYFDKYTIRKTSERVGKRRFGAT